MKDLTREELACVICMAFDSCSDKEPVKHSCVRALAAADRALAYFSTPEGQEKWLAYMTDVNNKRKVPHD